jgi:hypothetical protein
MDGRQTKRLDDERWCEKRSDHHTTTYDALYRPEGHRVTSAVLPSATLYDREQPCLCLTRTGRHWWRRTRSASFGTRPRRGTRVGSWCP